MEAYFLCYFNKNQAWNTNYRNLDLSSRLLSKRSDCYKHIKTYFDISLISISSVVHTAAKYQTFYFKLKLVLSYRYK